MAIFFMKTCCRDSNNVGKATDSDPPIPKIKYWRFSGQIKKNIY